MKQFYSKEKDPFIKTTGQKCPYSYKDTHNGKNITAALFHKGKYFDAEGFNAEDIPSFNRINSKKSRLYLSCLQHVKENVTFIDEYIDEKYTIKIVSHMMKTLVKIVTLKAIKLLTNNLTNLTNADKKIKTVAESLCKTKGSITENELKEICNVSRMTIHRALEKMPDIFKKIPDPQNTSKNRKIIILRGENNGL